MHQLESPQRIIISVIAGVVGSAVLLSSASAQSFNCARATTKQEKMICATPDLSKLDVEMTRAFTEARKGLDAALIGQATWLRTVRDACEAVACLNQAYRSRVAYLQTLRPGSTMSVDGLAGDWTRVDSSDRESTHLTIEMVRPQSFSFYIGATLQLGDDPGNVRVGEIEGTAGIRGGLAVYRDEDSECQVTFARVADRVVVSAFDCADMGGMGVRFDGEFRK